MFCNLVKIYDDEQCSEQLLALRVCISYVFWPNDNKRTINESYSYPIHFNRMDELQKKKCYSIYQNLVHCQSSLSGKDILASAYIREFFETSRCDGLHDFSPFRGELESRINVGDSKRLDRVIKFEENDVDEKVCAQACIHYHKWHNKHLVKALSWQDWAYYHVIERSERTVASLGILGAGYGGLKLAGASFRYVKNKIPKGPFKP
ncbi:MAG: hypothetical protein EOP48_01290 [Sphingobacteriales bacterium]|nr:MAG: hypothetical protein EOP48_01290 [Sphingobacteriales bacterium]